MAERGKPCTDTSQLNTSALGAKGTVNIQHLDHLMILCMLWMIMGGSVYLSAQVCLWLYTSEIVCECVYLYISKTPEQENQELSFLKCLKHMA